MWKWLYFGNGLNVENIKFLMCASNTYIICNWETDQGLELFQGIKKPFEENTNSHKRN